VVPALLPTELTYNILEGMDEQTMDKLKRSSLRLPQLKANNQAIIAAHNSNNNDDLVELETHNEKFYDEPNTRGGKRIAHNILQPGTSALERWEEGNRTESSDIV